MGHTEVKRKSRHSLELWTSILCCLRGWGLEQTRLKSIEVTRLKKTEESHLAKGSGSGEASVNELKDTGFRHLLRAVDTIIKGRMVLSAEMGRGGLGR